MYNGWPAIPRSARAADSLCIQYRGAKRRSDSGLNRTKDVHNVRSAPRLGKAVCLTQFRIKNSPRLSSYTCTASIFPFPIFHEILSNISTAAWFRLRSARALRASSRIFIFLPGDNAPRIDHRYSTSPALLGEHVLRRVFRTLVSTR